MMHGLTHKHATASKPGMGHILICSTRITDRVKGIWYRTPLAGSQWVQLPVDMDVYVRVLESDTYLEAMAIIRRAWNPEPLMFGQPLPMDAIRREERGQEDTP